RLMRLSYPVWFRLGRLRISARTGLSRAGIRPTARTRLLRSLEPAIRAGQRLVGTALLPASAAVLAGGKAVTSRPNLNLQRNRWFAASPLEEAGFEPRGHSQVCRSVRLAEHDGRTNRSVPRSAAAAIEGSVCRGTRCLMAQHAVIDCAIAGDAVHPGTL